MTFDIAGKSQIHKDESTHYNLGSPEEVLTEAKKYSEIKFSLIFTIYNDTPGKYNSRAILSDSDFNVMSEYLGDTVLDLAEDEYSCMSVAPYMPDGTTSKIVLFGNELSRVDSLDYKFENTQKAMTRLGYSSAYVVSDSILTDYIKEQTEYMCAIVLDTKSYLPIEFQDKYIVDGVRLISNRYTELNTINMQMSIIIISSLFLGFTFMLMSMALLSLKVMSDADKDKQRYRILNMLGVSVVRQRKILFRQIAMFFAAPLFIPLLMVVPATIASAIMSYFVLGFVHPSIIALGVVVPLVYFGIYACYFAATYFLTVAGCIKPMEKSRIKLLCDSPENDMLQ